MQSPRTNTKRLVGPPCSHTTAACSGLSLCLRRKAAREGGEHVRPSYFRPLAGQEHGPRLAECPGVIRDTVGVMISLLSLHRRERCKN